MVGTERRHQRAGRLKPQSQTTSQSDHSAVRLDINCRRKTIKSSNIWRLNNTLLNNQQITEEIKKEIKLCIESNENENTTTQNLWDTIKAVIRGRFIALQAYLKKQEKSQINNLTLHQSN